MTAALIDVDGGLLQLGNVLATVLQACGGVEVDEHQLGALAVQDVGHPVHATPLCWVSALYHAQVGHGPAGDGGATTASTPPVVPALGLPDGLATVPYAFQPAR